MKKILLILTALIVSAMTWAATDDLLCGGSFVGSFPNNESWIGSDVDYYSGNGYKFDTNETLQSPNLTDGVKKVTIKILVGHNGGATSTLKVGAYDSSDELLAETENIVPTVAYTDQTDAAIQTFTLDGMGTDIHYIKISFTKVKNYGMKTFKVYDATPSSMTLDSLVIKGKATKMEYEVGEAFDPAGLEVWGIYTKTVKHDYTSQIKSGITWTLDPETFEEASDNASVTMVASYKELTTADTTITGIKVNAVVPKMDKTFDFTKNLYGHKGVSSGSGEDYVSDGDIAVGEKFIEDPTQIEFTLNGSTQTRFWNASSKHELRLYNGATFDLSVVGDYKIIKVEFTGSAVNLTGNGVTVLSDKVWEGDAAKSVKFVNTTTGSKINSIKATYIAAAPAAANPTITADTVANVYWKPITVTLACETEGASIYYTTDGSEPTASATKYTAPFSVTATTTVKAIAMKGGLDNSEVVSKTFTFGTVFASLEELVEKQPAKDDVAYVQVTITNAVIDSFYVTSKGYTNGIYVTASNTVVELYTNDVPETWEVGGKVSGTIKAEWLLYKGTPELQKWEGGWDPFTYTAPGARKEFVFVAGEVAEANPTMFAITWGADGSSETVKMTKKAEPDIYVADILPTVDSVVLVRCAPDATGIIWDGDDKNVWNQTVNYPLSDTMYFGDWVEETNLFTLTSEPPKPVEVKYYAKNNWNGEGWTWKEMTKSDENVYTLDRVVFGGTGVNINTKEEDTDAKWFDLKKMTYVKDTIQAKDTVRFDLTISQEDTVLTATLLGRPAPVARKEFVFVAKEAAEADPTMFAITWGADGSSETVKMTKKAEPDIYVAEILPTVDSVVLVRCASDATEIIWDGDGKNVWNQTVNYPLSDTMYFGEWVEETNLFTLISPKSAPKVDKTGIIINGRKYGFPVRLVKDVK